MKKSLHNQAAKLLQGLTLDGFDKYYNEAQIALGDALIIRDAEIIISAEHENSYCIADYYGEFRGGYPWINPKLEKALESIGCFLEWQNPGALQVCEA